MPAARALALALFSHHLRNAHWCQSPPWFWRGCRTSIVLTGLMCRRMRPHLSSSSALRALGSKFIACPALDACAGAIARQLCAKFTFSPKVSRLKLVVAATTRADCPHSRRAFSCGRACAQSTQLRSPTLFPLRLWCIGGIDAGSRHPSEHVEGCRSQRSRPRSLAFPRRPDAFPPATSVPASLRAHFREPTQRPLDFSMTENIATPVSVHAPAIDIRLRHASAGDCMPPMKRVATGLLISSDQRAKSSSAVGRNSRRGVSITRPGAWGTAGLMLTAAREIGTQDSGGGGCGASRGTSRRHLWMTP